MQNKTKTDIGWKSTEFWLTIVSIPIMYHAVMMKIITSDQWLTFMMIVIPGYTVGRGLAKIGGRNEK
jgi:hypothetical protein